MGYELATLSHTPPSTKSPFYYHEGDGISLYHDGSVQFGQGARQPHYVVLERWEDGYPYVKVMSRDDYDDHIERLDRHGGTCHYGWQVMEPPTPPDDGDDDGDEEEDTWETNYGTSIKTDETGTYKLIETYGGVNVLVVVSVMEDYSVGIKSGSNQNN